MSELQECIKQLSDDDVVRLALWVFDEIREQIGGDLAEATMKEMNSDDIATAFNAALHESGLPSLSERPEADVMTSIFRASLLDFAESNPKIIEDTMEGLGMEAGWGTELADLIQGIGVPNLILILFVLKLNFSLHADIFRLDPKKGQIVQKKQMFGTDKNLAKMIFEAIAQFITTKNNAQ